MFDSLPLALTRLTVLGCLLFVPAFGCSADEEAESEEAQADAGPPPVQAADLTPEALVREFMYATMIGNQRQGDALTIPRENSDKLYQNVISPDDTKRKLVMGKPIRRLAVGEELPTTNVPIHLTLEHDDGEAAEAQASDAGAPEGDAEGDGEGDETSDETGEDGGDEPEAAPALVTEDYINDERMLLATEDGIPQLFVLVKVNGVWLIDPAPQIEQRTRPRKGNRRPGF